MAKMKQWKRKYSDEELEIARQMYMNFDSVSMIARECGMSRGAVQHYERTYWKAEREELSSDLMNAIGAEKRQELGKITKETLKVLGRALEYLGKRKEPPSTKEALDAAKILQVMDKLVGVETKEQEEEEYIDVTDLGSLDPFNSNKKEENAKLANSTDTIHDQNN